MFGVKKTEFDGYANVKLLEAELLSALYPDGEEIDINYMDIFKNLSIGEFGNPELSEVYLDLLPVTLARKVQNFIDSWEQRNDEYMLDIFTKYGPGCMHLDEDIEDVYSVSFITSDMLYC